MSEHRPWMVSNPRMHFGYDGKVTIVLQSPRATRSFRRIMIPSHCAYGLRITSLRIGSVETGREILETGPIPGAFLTESVDTEMFDVPIESGQSIVVVAEENMGRGDSFYIEGLLLGLGP